MPPFAHYVPLPSIWYPIRITQILLSFMSSQLSVFVSYKVFFLQESWLILQFLRIQGLYVCIDLFKEFETPLAFSSNLCSTFDQPVNAAQSCKYLKSVVTCPALSWRPSRASYPLKMAVLSSKAHKQRIRAPKYHFWSYMAHFDKLLAPNSMGSLQLS